MICSCPPLSQAPTARRPPTDPYAGFGAATHWREGCLPGGVSFGERLRRYTEAQYNEYSPWQECADECVANNSGHLPDRPQKRDYCMMTVSGQGATHTTPVAQPLPVRPSPWAGNGHTPAGRRAPPSVVPTPPSAAPTAVRRPSAHFHDDSAFTQTNGCSATTSWTSHRTAMAVRRQVAPAKLPPHAAVAGRRLHLSALRGGDFNMQGYNDHGWLFCWSETELARSVTAELIGSPWRFSRARTRTWISGRTSTRAWLTRATQALSQQPERESVARAVDQGLESGTARWPDCRRRRRRRFCRS